MTRCPMNTEFSQYDERSEKKGRLLKFTQNYHRPVRTWIVISLFELSIQLLGYSEVKALRQNYDTRFNRAGFINDEF